MFRRFFLYLHLHQKLYHGQNREDLERPQNVARQTTIRGVAWLKWRTLQGEGIKCKTNICYFPYYFNLWVDVWYGPFTRSESMSVPGKGVLPDSWLPPAGSLCPGMNRECNKLILWSCFPVLVTLLVLYPNARRVCCPIQYTESVSYINRLQVLFFLWMKGDGELKNGHAQYLHLDHALKYCPLLLPKGMNALLDPLWSRDE